jgi:hypothetical protein
VPFKPLVNLADHYPQSIYWFHCGEDLLAWRAIGNAGREALEVGLHRRTSLFENFKDPKERDLAIRCFWCVYILDRRWSYGTSLSFGISDRDIDPQLPEPVRRSIGTPTTGLETC